MRAALVLALAALMAGCLCLGGGDETAVETASTTVTLEPTTTEKAPETTLETEAAPATETTEEASTSTIAAVTPEYDCSKLPTRADKDICTVMHAALARNASVCQTVSQPSVKRLCNSMLIDGKCTGFGNPGDRIMCEAALSGEADRCKAVFSADRDACFFMVAVFNRDASACDRAAGTPGKALCLSLLGACSRTADQRTLEYCEENVRKMTRF